MQPGKLFSGIALMLFVSIPLHAEDFYYGISVGYGSLNPLPPNVDTDTVAAGITAPEGLTLIGQPTVGFDFDISDEKDINWSLYAGYNFNRYFTAEGGYMNFGKSIISTNLTAGITTSLPDLMMGTQTSDAAVASQFSTKTTGFHISGIARYSFLDEFNYNTFSVYGKAGVIMWDTDTNIRQDLMPFSLQTTADPEGSDDEPVTSRLSSGDKGVNFLLGIGADYRITNEIGIRAEWVYYRGIDGRDLKLFSLGAFYQFWL